MLSSLAGRFLHPKQNNVQFQKIVRQSWLTTIQMLLGAGRLLAIEGGGGVEGNNFEKAKKISVPTTTSS